MTDPSFDDTLDSSEECADCGDAIGETDYRFGEGGALCWACANRRGGRYDPVTERWVTAPRLSDLAHAYRPMP